MMKNFKYVMMMAVATLVGFSSCSSDDEAERADNSAPKSVYLKISNSPSTYSEGAPVADGSTVGFSSGELFFVNGSGAIVGHYTIGAGATSQTNINMGEITGTGANLTNLPGSITAVHIVGNVPAGVTLPTTGNISAVKAQALDVETQGDIAKVNLYGTNTLTLVTGTNYTATVNLAPTVSRIELTNMKAGGVVTGFQVDGIFIDNYYAQGSVDGSVLATNLTVNSIVATDFTDDSGAYPATLKPFIYDWYTTGLASVSGTAAPATGVWNYNVFATAEGSAMPRIVIRLSEFTTNDGSTIASPQFVTIRGLKDNGTSLTAIKAGEVYSIATDAFVIDELVVTPSPNQSTIDVEVKVTLASWRVVDVTPEI